jgi:hypothetical protein
MKRGSVVDVGVNRKAVWGGEVARPVRLVLALVLAALSASCGDMVREGTASSFLIVNAVEGASGAEPNRFSGTLQSDVVTVVQGSPTIFNDLGRVRFSMALKDPGGSELPSSPTTNNFITINRYRVEYVRADGRNTPGVDIPWPFDGAITLTVGDSEATGIFTLVRHQAKVESPLGNLARNLVIISTIANITFYGRDQTGREVIGTASISVDFANFGDPA